KLHARVVEGMVAAVEILAEINVVAGSNQNTNTFQKRERSMRPLPFFVKIQQLQGMVNISQTGINWTCGECSVQSGYIA
ncbi:MAG TPA: hypothetical protein PKM72_05955, partial [Nitrospirales bacterium]|nr:hypothetical protein [Nitrospirales bacterium]